MSGCTEADNEIAVAKTGERPAEVATAVQELSCKAFEQNFAELIGGSRDCNTDADCVVTEFGCPFGCANAVNRSKLQGLQSAYLESAESCRSCLYDCGIGPSTVLPVCRSGKCDFVNKN